MSYRIAYSTNAYTKWTLSKAISDIRDRGFDGVEILADDPHAFPPSDPSSIVKALNGFPVSNLNGNTFRGEFLPSLIDPDPKARKTRIDYIRGVIDLARKIGAKTVCTSSGLLPRDVSPEQGVSWMIDSLRDILNHAEKEPQIRVGVEYEPGFLVESATVLHPILDTIEHPLLGVNLDIGHSVCVGEALPLVIQSFAGRIWNLHVEDIVGQVHDHLIPGKGNINFGEVKSSLDQIGYEEFLTLEIYPYKDRPGEAGTESLEFLRKTFESP